MSTQTANLANIIIGEAFNPGQPTPCARQPDLFEGPNKRRTRPRLDHPLTQHQYAAIIICHSCPVLEACREWALKHALDDANTQGGLTGEQRRAIVNYVLPERRGSSSPGHYVDPTKPVDTCRKGHERPARTPGGRCRTCISEYDKNHRQQNARARAERRRRQKERDRETRTEAA